MQSFTWNLDVSTQFESCEILEGKTFNFKINKKYLMYLHNTGRQVCYQLYPRLTQCNFAIKTTHNQGQSGFGSGKVIMMKKYKHWYVIFGHPIIGPSSCFRGGLKAKYQSISINNCQFRQVGIIPELPQSAVPLSLSDPDLGCPAVCSVCAVPMWGVLTGAPDLPHCNWQRDLEDDNIKYSMYKPDSNTCKMNITPSYILLCDLALITITNIMHSAFDHFTMEQM